MSKLIKLPTPIYEQNHPDHGLQAGDIIITYQNPRHGSLSDSVVSSFQSLWNEEGGHHNAEHGAFVIEVDGKLKLAHLLSKGFVIEDLNNKRTKHVYRIKDETDRKDIARALNQLFTEKNNFFKENLFWRYFIIAVTFLRRSINSIGIKNTSLINQPRPSSTHEIAVNSICTKFVADCMVEATHRVNTPKNLSEKYINIHTMTAPKTLQAYLDRNLNYEAFIVPQAGNALCEKVIKMIPSTPKTAEIHQAIEVFEKNCSANNDYEKTRRLIQYISPLLKHHPKLQAELNRFLKSQGLHRNYIDANNIVESAENIKRWLKDRNYDADEVAMYTIYRQRGLSDAESQFLVRPTLGQWFALHPIRITLVSLLLPVVGVLAVLGLGISKIASAKAERHAFVGANPCTTVAIGEVMNLGLTKSESSMDLTPPFHSTLFAKADNTRPQPQFNHSVLSPV